VRGCGLFEIALFYSESDNEGKRKVNKPDLTPRIFPTLERSSFSMVTIAVISVVVLAGVIRRLEFLSKRIFPLAASIATAARE